MSAVDESEGKSNSNNNNNDNDNDNDNVEIQINDSNMNTDGVIIVESENEGGNVENNIAVDGNEERKESDKNVSNEEEKENEEPKRIQNGNSEDENKNIENEKIEREAEEKPEEKEEESSVSKVKQEKENEKENERNEETINNNGSKSKNNNNDTETDKNYNNSNQKKLEKSQSIHENESKIHFHVTKIPKLIDICISVLAANFNDTPVLSALPKQIQQSITSKLSTRLDIFMAVQDIDDDNYWKRCCLDRWKDNCDVKYHGMVWKRMYLERNLAEEIEEYDNVIDDEFLILSDIVKLMKLSSKYVTTLKLKQILCSLDLSILFTNLKEMTNLILSYGPKNCGMNFEWKRTGMMLQDCRSLSTCLKSKTIPIALTSLTLASNRLDDESIRVICQGLLENKTVTNLDLSHNRIGDRGMRAITKVLDSPTCVITHLHLNDNDIHTIGGKSVGRALRNNKSLLFLDLCLNHLGEEGCKFLFEGLKANNVLLHLNVANNSMSDEAAKTLATTLQKFNKCLTSLIIYGNSMKSTTLKYLKESVESNKIVTTFDYRFCSSNLIKD